MSMLDIQVPKPLILHLVLEIFLKYLGGLGEVVANVAFGLGLPMASDLQKHIEEDAVVPWVPFLSGFCIQSQEEHHQRVTRACHFMFHLYNVVPFYDIDWYTDFRNLVFPLPLFIAHVDATIGPADEVIPDVIFDASLPLAHV